MYYGISAVTVPYFSFSGNPGTEGIVVTGLFLLSLVSLYFSLRIIYHRDKKRYMGLGMVLMLASLAMVLIFSILVFAYVINPPHGKPFWL